MTLIPPLDGDFEEFRQLLLQELGLPAYDDTPSQELLQRWFTQGHFAYCDGTNWLTV